MEKRGRIESDGFTWQGGSWEPNPPKPDRRLNGFTALLIGTPGSEILYYEEIVRKYPDGRAELVSSKPVFRTAVRTSIGEDCVNDCDGQGVELFAYILPDGRQVREFIQASVDDADFFIALKDENGATL